MTRTILLNPGPVTLSKRVRDALLGDDICHREPEFAALQSDIRRKLLNVYSLDEQTWTSALMTGSGTAAVEAMVSSLVPADGKLLVVENGVYGERMTRIAERYGIACERISTAWADPIALDDLDRMLSDDPGISHVAVVHHETTTGRLNDLAPVAALCRKHNLALLLDAVSSFGAEAIDFADWPIAGCAATANKCLHGVPGTCFVIVNKTALAQGHSRNLYLDIASYVDAQERAGTPFTQSIQTFYALDEALDELFDTGGVEARGALYRNRMSRIRETLCALNIEPLLAGNEMSCVLHAYRLPAGMNYTKLHDELKKAGFVIYAGQGKYTTEIFRISMMGDIRDDDIERLIAALQTALA